MRIAEPARTAAAPADPGGFAHAVAGIERNVGTLDKSKKNVGTGLVGGLGFLLPFVQARRLKALAVTAAPPRNDRR